MERAFLRRQKRFFIFLYLIFGIGSRTRSDGRAAAVVVVGGEGHRGRGSSVRRARESRRYNYYARSRRLRRSFVFLFHRFSLLRRIFPPLRLYNLPLTLSVSVLLVAVATNISVRVCNRYSVVQQTKYPKSHHTPIFGRLPPRYCCRVTVSTTCIVPNPLPQEISRVYSKSDYRMIASNRPVDVQSNAISNETTGPNEMFFFFSFQAEISLFKCPRSAQCPDIIV